MRPVALKVIVIDVRQGNTMIKVYHYPTRDGCLYLGESGEREWVHQLQHFVLLIARQPLGGFSSNLEHIYSSPGKNFRIWCHNISTNQRSHMTKNMFLKVCACLDDNLKSARALHLFT